MTTCHTTRRWQQQTSVWRCPVCDAMSCAGIGVGSNRRGYFLWAPCLSFNPPYLVRFTVFVRRLHLIEERARFCGVWPLEATSCHALDDVLAFEYFLVHLLLVIYCSSFITRHLLLVLYCVYFLDLFIAHHLFFVLYLYLVSSFGLRVAHLYHYRRARLLVRLDILTFCCTLPQPCSARSGHISLPIVRI